MPTAGLSDPPEISFATTSPKVYTNPVHNGPSMPWNLISNYDSTTKTKSTETLISKKKADDSFVRCPIVRSYVRPLIPQAINPPQIPPAI